MPSHHTTPGGTSDPHYLVTTVHADGVTCHHTGATLEEVRAYASEHARDETDITTFWVVAPGHLDGVHWMLLA